jgi:predicted dehydrogenase
MTPLRAAVIGLGVGEQHLAGYAAHPASEVVAVCDLDEAKLARHQGLRTTTDARELLTDPDIDIVSVASWDDAHFEQVRLALESGKHVFAEKPLVLHEHEAAAIAELLRRPGAPRLSTNVPLRLSPRFVRLREMIGTGRLGELFHIEGDYDYGRRHKLTDGWRGRIPHYSVVLGGAIHMVDLVLWLTGLRVTEVIAAASNDIATRGTAFRHPDFVTATLRADGGATIKVNANLGSVSPHFHGLRVYGTEGTFVNGLPDAQLHTRDGIEARTETIADAYPGVAKGDLIGPFVDSIVSGSPAAVSEQDVFEVLAVCFAIDRAAASGGPVAVERLL